MNYSLREYARNILRTLQEVCIAENLPQPNVISESGRALTAHHAVLIADVIDRDEVPVQTVETPRSEEHTSELQSLMRISYAVFCSQKNTNEAMTRHPHLT